MSSNYLGIGLAIATGVAASLAASLQAQAQNLNLQTQIDINSPSPLASQPARQIAAPSPSPSPTTLCSTDPKRAAKKIRSLLSEKSAMSFENLNVDPGLMAELRAHTKNTRNRKETKDDLEVYFLQNPLACEAAFVLFPPTPRPALNVMDHQPTTVLVNFPINPTYETDVLKSGSNSSPGVSAGFGGNVLVTTAGLPGRPFDLVAFGGGSASARYPEYSLKSLDTATAMAAYQFYLDGYQYKKNGEQEYILPGAKDVNTSPNMITVDTLALELLNQTAFTAGYHTEQANLLTPEIILSKQNMDLDDPKLGGCFSGTAFCHYANFSLTVGQTFSDVLTQQNANVAGSATLGWRIDPSWTLALQTAATARAYENFLGGRDDLLLQGGPVLTYAPAAIPIPGSGGESALVSFSLPVTYYKNYSTVSAAVWSGLVIMPTLTIAFSYTPTAKSGQ
jgi:hypothetical protein